MGEGGGGGGVTQNTTFILLKTESHVTSCLYTQMETDNASALLIKIYDFQEAIVIMYFLKIKISNAKAGLSKDNFLSSNKAK